MSLFKTAYDLQQRLADAEPQHQLVQNKYMAEVEGSHQLRADGEFLTRYQQSGTVNQLRAYISDLEAALAKIAEKPVQPV